MRYGRRSTRNAQNTLNSTLVRKVIHDPPDSALAEVSRIEVQEQSYFTAGLLQIGPDLSEVHAVELFDAFPRGSSAGDSIL
jgi:hypothetical protein